MNYLFTRIGPPYLAIRPGFVILVGFFCASCRNVKKNASIIAIAFGGEQDLLTPL